MDTKEIHDYARRFVGAHGDKAELEAAQKAAECERQATRVKPKTGAASRPRSRRCAVRTRADRPGVRHSAGTNSGQACSPRFDADQHRASFDRQGAVVRLSHRGVRPGEA